MIKDHTCLSHCQFYWFSFNAMPHCITGYLREDEIQQNCCFFFLHGHVVDLFEYVLSHFLLCTGPMVYGICYCPISMKERLGELGFAGERNFLMFSMEMFFMQNSNYGLEVGNQQEGFLTFVWKIPKISDTRPSFMFSRTFKTQLVNFNFLPEMYIVKMVVKICYLNLKQLYQVLNIQACFHIE